MTAGHPEECGDDRLRGLSAQVAGQRAAGGRGPGLQGRWGLPPVQAGARGRGDAHDNDDDDYNNNDNDDVQVISSPRDTPGDSVVWRGAAIMAGLETAQVSRKSHL